jgi:hypothetical protein
MFLYLFQSLLIPITLYLHYKLSNDIEVSIPAKEFRLFKIQYLNYLVILLFYLYWFDQEFISWGNSYSQIFTTFFFILYFLQFLYIWLSIAILVADTAFTKKDYNWNSFFWLTLFLGFIIPIILAFIKSSKQKSTKDKSKKNKISTKIKKDLIIGYVLFLSSIIIVSLVSNGRIELVNWNKQRNDEIAQRGVDQLIQDENDRVKEWLDSLDAKIVREKKCLSSLYATGKLSEKDRNLIFEVIKGEESNLQNQIETYRSGVNENNYIGGDKINKTPEQLKLYKNFSDSCK